MHNGLRDLLASGRSGAWLAQLTQRSTFCRKKKTFLFVSRRHNSERTDLHWTDKWYRRQIRNNPHDPYSSYHWNRSEEARPFHDSAEGCTDVCPSVLPVSS